jgi:hypothetical protein
MSTYVIRGRFGGIKEDVFFDPPTKYESTDWAYNCFKADITLFETLEEAEEGLNKLKSSTDLYKFKAHSFYIEGPQGNKIKDHIKVSTIQNLLEKWT